MLCFWLFSGAATREQLPLRGEDGSAFLGFWQRWKTVSDEAELNVIWLNSKTGWKAGTLFFFMGQIVEIIVVSGEHAAQRAIYLWNIVFFLACKLILNERNRSVKLNQITQDNIKRFLLSFFNKELHFSLLFKF